jgi:ABC-type lipoprotein release transport system permease subunit
VRSGAGLAQARLRRRRGRVLLAALGITAVAVMIGASATIAYSLATGFDRAAARADMPDVIASFDPVSLDDVRARASALPNVAALSYRLVQSGVPIRNLTTGRRFGVDPHRNDHAVVEGVLPGGRRGYAIVAGRDLTGRPLEAVIERGLAQAWHIGIGDLVDLRGFDHPHGPDAFRVVGIAVAPDSVAFPLASGPRVYIPYQDARRLYFHELPHPINQLLVWVHNRSLLPITLEQARAATYGVGGFQFATRSGIRVLVDGAAGIVISLLVAFSVIALGSAAVMLSAASYAAVQRQLQSLGAARAVGASRLQIVSSAVAEALVVAAPATAIGLAVGWAVASGPTAALLDSLSEFGAGWALLGVLAASWAGVCLTVAVTSGWPAWRATARPPADMLRRPETGGAPRLRWVPGGTLGLGMRMALARPVRTAATTLVVATSTGILLLMLSLATLLDHLEHDPQTVGKRYALTAAGVPGALPLIRALPGVAQAAPRYVTTAVDSFNLGESFQLIGYPGDPTSYEDPPLVAGRWRQSPGSAVVGVGLANALNLRVGSTLVAELPSGNESRFHVVGIVASLQSDGQVAYVRSSQLLQADPLAASTISIDLAPGILPGSVRHAISELGLSASSTGGVTAHSAAFLAVLATLLRTVAAIDGLVCLYAVVQVLSLTARERASAVATLRACGAGRRQLAGVFLGAALVIGVAALPVAVALERTVLGPRTAGLAASYAVLSIEAGPRLVALVGVGMAGIAVAAAAGVTRSALRAPTVNALRGSD